MRLGARTPEELDDLLEDAFVLQDGAGLAGLFADHAVLVVGGGPPTRGAAAIGRVLVDRWSHDRTYVARPRDVLQARDVALVVAEAGLHVLRRDADGWRATISLLDLDTSIAGRTP